MQRETQLSVDVSPNFCDCFQYLILGIGTLIMRLKMARYKLQNGLKNRILQFCKHSRKCVDCFSINSWVSLQILQ